MKSVIAVVIATVLAAAALVAAGAPAGAAADPEVDLVPLGQDLYQPVDVVRGPDGAMWVVSSYQLGRIDPFTGEGEIIDAADLHGVTDIALGPDGNLWMLGTSRSVPVEGRLWRYDVDADELTAFPASAACLTALTSGPGDSLWVVGRTTCGGTPTDLVAEVDPDTGTLTAHTLTNLTYPAGIAPGPDGNLWITGLHNARIGRFDPDTFQLSTFPTAPILRPGEVAAGPDGNLWITGSGADELGRVVPGTGVVTRFAFPSDAQVSNDGPVDLAVDHGRLWVLSAGGVTGDAEIGVHASDGALAHVDPATGGVLSSIPLDRPLASLAFDAGGAAWTVGYLNGPDRVDTTSGDVLGLNTLRAVTPRDLAVDPDGHVWAGPDGPRSRRVASAVFRVDATSARRLALPALAEDWAMALAPDGQLWVGGSDPDDATGTRLTRLTSGGAPAGAGIELPAPPGELADLLVAGDGRLWVSWTDPSVGQTTARVLVYEPDGTAIADVDVPLNPTRMVEDAAGDVWVIGGGSTKALSRIDASTFAVSTVDLPVEPVGIAATATDLWLTTAQDGTLLRVDVATAAVDTVPAPVSAARNPQVSAQNWPNSVTIGPDGGVWVLDPADDRVARIDPATEDAEEITIPGISEVDAIDAGTDAVWVSVVPEPGTNGPALARLGLALPALDATLVAEPDTVAPGDEVELTVTITNTGDVPLTEVKVTDATVEGCAGPAGDGTLAVGAEVTVDCTLTASAADVGDPRHDTATVDSDQTAPTTTDPTTVTVAFAPHGFADLGPGDAADEPARWARHFGIVPASGNFRPDDPLARRQAVQWAHAMVDRPHGARHRFTDVPRTAAYKPALKWAFEHDVVRLYPGDRFKPDKALNRAQFVWMVWNVLGAPDAGGHHHPFTDVAPTAWYAPALDWADAHGLAGPPGPGGTFAPKEPVTRGQVLAALHRIAGEPALWIDVDGGPPSTVRF